MNFVTYAGTEQRSYAYASAKLIWHDISASKYDYDKFVTVLRLTMQIAGITDQKIGVVTQHIPAPQKSCVQCHNIAAIT